MRANVNVLDTYLRSFNKTQAHTIRTKLIEKWAESPRGEHWADADIGAVWPAPVKEQNGGLQSHCPQAWVCETAPEIAMSEAQDARKVREHASSPRHRSSAPAISGWL